MPRESVTIITEMISSLLLLFSFSSRNYTFIGSLPFFITLTIKYISASASSQSRFRFIFLKTLKINIPRYHEHFRKAYGHIPYHDNYIFVLPSPVSSCCIVQHRPRVATQRYMVETLSKPE